jgi:hypothetical protein
VAIDELAYIGAGVSYWHKLDLRMNPNTRRSRWSAE